MLKLAAWVLLLVNLGLLAGHAGWLDTGPGRKAGASLREPERLARQVNPGAIRLLPSADALAALAAASTASAASAASADAAAAAEAKPGADPASSPASAPTSAPTSVPTSAAADTTPRCLEAGPMDAAAVAAAERSLAAAGLVPSQWESRRLPAGDAYLVYMGRYPDAAAATRKLDELHQLKLQATELRNAPALQPGLSLGQYDSAAAAEAALARFAQRGVRTAKVVTLPGQGPVRNLLRLPQADATLQALAAAMALPGGRAFKACGTGLGAARPSQAPSR